MSILSSHMTPILGHPRGLFGVLKGTIHRLVPALKRYEAVGGSGPLNELAPSTTFIMHLGADIYAYYGEIYPYLSLLPIKLTSPWKAQIPFYLGHNNT